jgi:hypothetical protein
MAARVQSVTHHSAVSWRQNNGLFDVEINHKTE